MRNQSLFETPFVSEVSTKYCSKCSRLGAGKCLCKGYWGEASPSSTTRTFSKPNNETQWLFEALFESDDEKAWNIINEFKGKGRSPTGSNLYFIGLNIQKRSSDLTLSDGVRAILKQEAEKAIAKGAKQWASGIINAVEKNMPDKRKGPRSGGNAIDNAVATQVDKYIKENNLPDLVIAELKSKNSQAPMKARGKTHKDGLPAATRKQRKQPRRGAGKSSREFEFLFESPFF